MLFIPRRNPLSTRAEFQKLEPRYVVMEQETPEAKNEITKNDMLRHVKRMSKYECLDMLKKV